MITYIKWVTHPHVPNINTPTHTHFWSIGSRKSVFQNKKVKSYIFSSSALPLPTLLFPFWGTTLLNIPKLLAILILHPSWCEIWSLSLWYWLTHPVTTENTPPKWNALHQRNRGKSLTVNTNSSRGLREAMRKIKVQSLDLCHLLVFNHIWYNWWAHCCTHTHTHFFCHLMLCVKKQELLSFHFYIKKKKPCLDAFIAPESNLLWVGGSHARSWVICLPIAFAFIPITKFHPCCLWVTGNSQPTYCTADCSTSHLWAWCIFLFVGWLFNSMLEGRSCCPICIPLREPS